MPSGPANPGERSIHASTGPAYTYALPVVNVSYHISPSLGAGLVGDESESVTAEPTYVNSPVNGSHSNSELSVPISIAARDLVSV